MALTRTFLIDDQWNMVHLPERPNGFAVFILGDTNHYVDEHTSFWVQSPFRAHLIDILLEKGYTVFYSNLYGRHWGSPDAVQLAKSVYHMVIRKEIVNPKMHLLVEGMGALVALELLKNESITRSAVMMNPCLNLRTHIMIEMENKLFYKRLIKEIARSYHIREKDVPVAIERMKTKTPVLKTPILILHESHGGNYPLEHHSRRFETQQNALNGNVRLCLHIHHHDYPFAEMITAFYQKHERI